MQLPPLRIVVVTHSLDELYEVLANVHRRRLLFGLLEENPRTDSPIDIGAPPDAVVADDAARIEHRHVHLPKLDDYGFVEWTPSLNSVETGPRFEEVRPVLEALADHHDLLSHPQ